MKRFIKKAFLLLLPLIILVIFFSSTNPNSLSLPLLVAPVLLIAASIYFYCLKFLGWLNPKNKNSSGQKVLAFVFASGLTSLVILQSINQLSLRDFSLFCLFTVILAGYIKRMRNAS